MSMNHTVEEIGKKMDELGLWELLAPYNWALKPRGTVFPYFCTVLKGDRKPVKARFLMLEGWQTLHEYVHVRVDRNFGFCSTPMEFPHYELVVLESGETHLFRHDTGYMPLVANAAQREFAAKMLWEAFGVMLRVETDRNLPMKFSDDQAIFARVEGPDGKWTDEPLAIPPPRPHVEKVSFAKADVQKAVDLPLSSKDVIELDFRILPSVMTKEPRPRCVYALVGVDGATGAKLIDSRVSMHPEAGLKGLWESMPPQVLRELIRLGKVPGEIRLCSGRVFRLLRPMCMELPFRLSLHDSLPRLEAAFK